MSSPHTRVVGRNVHSAACYDDEGKCECCCGLLDHLDEVMNYAEPPDDGPMLHEGNSSIEGSGPFPFDPEPF